MTTTSTQTTSSKQTSKLKSKRITPLQYQRLLRGWSQGELAAQIYALCIRDGHTQVAITHQSVHQWESGKHRPTPLYRKQLCELFGMNALELGFLDDLLQDPPLSDDPAPTGYGIQMLVRGHAQDSAQ